MRKLHTTLTAGFCALAMGIALADPPPPPLAIHHVEKSLSCGDAQLSIKTDYALPPDVTSVAWTAQSITLKSAAHPTPVSLALESKPLHLAYYPQGTALDSVILGWTCLKTASGKHYIFLAYTCTPSPERPQCNADDESGNWDSILDTSGKRMSDKQRDSLGINRAIGDQIKLEDTTDN
ncbi:hypothetical protein [Dyella mobilis]|uniref:Uncharacterized protein n=1 Tax=Dyella mobilis TaxID=1849582 RepID=A0ABS2KJA6_9GAMM|nr:hypothetical protein [Dyella mobilis]MBM7131241.1 hypothetical protein [Dyella mobilis]GLQ98822.1 hypothetical protein GCM10007863_32420 [Dyella mobilis]